MKWIDISNIKKQYQDQNIVFEDIMIQKRLTILKGKNGSGKSTLMKAILGLIHFQGEIKHALECGYFPEKIMLPSHLKVETFLQMMLPHKVRSKTEELIALFDMKEHMQKEIHMLSKGMHMKCRLIYTLSLDKDMYLLDEPFNGLDEVSLSRFIHYIKHHKKMFLISTHLDVFEPNNDTEVISL